MPCAIRPAKFDGNVLALDITEVSKANPQRRNAIGPNRSGAKIQPTNCRDFFRLLRACRKRPGGRAANQSDEFAAASPYAPDGIVRIKYARKKGLDRNE